MRSLRTWLALGLVAAIVAPVAAGLGAWLLAGGWQTGREQARVDSRDALVAAARRDRRPTGTALSQQLTPARRRGRAHRPSSRDRTAVVDGRSSKAIKAPGRAVITAGPGGAAAVARLQAAGRRHVSRRRPSSGRASRGRCSCAARARRCAGRSRSAPAAVALAVVLVLAVGLLRRWVLRPLARLAAGAERIAGGELGDRPGRHARPRGRAGGRRAARHGRRARAARSARATAAERERRFLVTAIAHDLRTPLFTLRGSLEAIERGIGDERLARARPGQGRPPRPARRRPVRVLARRVRARDARRRAGRTSTAIARRAAETVEPGAVRLDVVTNGPVPLDGDPVALQRVLTNLLDNALRHARTRVELRVTGRASRSPTTGRASRRRTCRTCSSRSTAATRRARRHRRRGPRARDRPPAGARPRRRGRGRERPRGRRPRDGDAQFQLSAARGAQ